MGYMTIVVTREVYSTSIHIYSSYIELHGWISILGGLNYILVEHPNVSWLPSNFQQTLL